MKLRITVEGKVYDVDVEIVGEQAPAAPVAASAAYTPPPARPAAPAASAPAQSSGRGKTFPSPLAGTVRAIHVKPGDKVEANQDLLMLEAMKMETSVSAVSAGTVKAILVSVGDAVTSGQALVEFE